MLRVRPRSAAFRPDDHPNALLGVSAISKPFTLTTFNHFSLSSRYKFNFLLDFKKSFNISASPKSCKTSFDRFKIIRI